MASTEESESGEEGQAEIVWVTHRAREKNLLDALEAIRALPSVYTVSNSIRVEG